MAKQNKKELDTSLERNTEPPEAIVTGVVAQGDATVLPEGDNRSESLLEGVELIVEGVSEPDAQLIPTIPLVSEELSLKDAWDRPIETTELLLRETNLNTFVDKILYASYLGGALVDKQVPRIDVPMTCKMLFPVKELDSFYSQDKKLQYEEGKDYLKVTLKGYGRYDFFKLVQEAGRKGVILEPKKLVKTGNVYLASILTRSPVKDTLETVVSPEKISYTIEELKEMDINQLKIVGSWYGEGGRGRDTLIKTILQKQKEVNNAV